MSRHLERERTPLLQATTFGNLPNQSYRFFDMNLLFCKCQKSLTERKLMVDVLAIFFGIGAWIAINGMFVQLPLLVETQPEGWNLPSFLTVIIQIANVGPILYSICRSVWPGKIRDSWIIYGLLMMGTVALLLMAFFYKETTFVGDKETSTSLFVLVFFIALVGCTSSVLFMPYMGNFREIYLVSYFVGEGLSGFLPSVVALGQGVGGNPTCVNQTNPDGSSSLVPYTPPPRFTTQVFFFFLFGTLALSTLSFFLLNNLNISKKEKVSNTANNVWSRTKSAPANVKTEDVSTSTDLNGTIDSSSIHSSLELSANPIHAEAVILPGTLSSTGSTYLLLMVAWVALLGNGVFPSIQSYSCLPYGNIVYHLAATLGSMANPLACFLAFFLPVSSIISISAMTVASLAVSGYLIATSLMSPVPPLVGTTAGEVLVVLGWILNTGLVSYVKLSIASLFRREPGRALFWCGAVQQMGSAVGAIITFFLVNYTGLFQAYFPCQ